MKIVVIGGTGRIGSKVVARLRGQGHEVIAAAPANGIDILSGQGLDAAMAGARVVVDLANSLTFDEAALDFFRTAGRNMFAAETKAGVGLHVALSVVGTERLLASGYFRAKLAQEEMIRDSGIAYTIVRSTQFFEFLPAIIASGVSGAAVRLTPALMQPIASDEVAEAVARFALQPAVNGIVEIAGPEREALAGLAERFMNLTEDPREVIVDAQAPYYGIDIGNETLVPSDPVWKGALNFARWFEQSEFAGEENARGPH